MSSPEALLVAVRAVHYGAAVVLFGEIVFAGLAAVDGRWAAEQPLAGEAATAAQRRRSRVIATAWAATMVSGALWLVLATVGMSGRPFAEAVAPSALANVLGQTVFGQAWSLRAVLALALLGLWPGWREGTRRRGSAWFLAASLAGALLASLAWAGHANAEIGVDGWIHHACDAAHLLAAGAWLGGLAPLAAVLDRLGSGPASDEAGRCARIIARFGNLAAGCVGVLVATGVVNAYYLLPTPLSLVETAYGKLLLAKIALFAVMLVVAVVNRMRLTPALGAARASPGLAGSTARRLRRNVWIEQALGAAVILIVAALGITPPPMPMSM